MTIPAEVKALSLALFLSLAPAPLMAAPPDVAAQVSQQLSAQGYRQIEVRRTLLGKVVVTARGHGHKREIVIDPRNGALLRDLVRQADGRQGTVNIARVGDREDDGKDDAKDDDDDNSGSGSGGDDDGDDDHSGSGGGGDDDDRDDDDNSGSGGGGDDDDRDDDNSGSGGGDDDDSDDRDSDRDSDGGERDDD